MTPLWHSKLKKNNFDKKLKCKSHEKVDGECKGPRRLAETQAYREKTSTLSFFPERPGFRQASAAPGLSGKNHMGIVFVGEKNGNPVVFPERPGFRQASAAPGLSGKNDRGVVFSREAWGRGGLYFLIFCNYASYRLFS